MGEGAPPDLPERSADTVQSVYDKIRAARQLERLRRQGLAEPAPPDPTAEFFAMLPMLIGGAAVVGLAYLFYSYAYPVYDKVPSGKMQTLKEYLIENLPERLDPRDKPPGNYGGKAPPPGGAKGEKDLSGIELRPIDSPVELWQVYAFATAQIVEASPSMVFERNFLWSLLLQTVSFPRVYKEWQSIEGCSVEEVSAGPDATTLRPVASSAPPPKDVPRQVEAGSSAAALADRELVLACGEMVEEYGLSLVARSADGEIAGCANMRVKRLPEDCHIDYDAEDEEPSVICTVERNDALGADALEGVAYLEYIAVSRSWRGCRLADKLLSFVESKARAWGLRLLGLHVHRDNWAALKFYQKRGFEISSDWLGWGDGFFLLLKAV